MDEGTKQCPNADPAFLSIQDAVNAAQANDTIAICPGLYREGAGGGANASALVIDRPLKIVGAGADLVRIEPKEPVGTPAAPKIRDDKGNVVLVSGTAGRVDISGVTVAAERPAEPSGPARAEAGVVFHNASGSLTRSRVTELVPASAVDYSTGVGQGVVAFTDDVPAAPTGPVDVTVSRTLIDGHAKGGMLIDAPADKPLTGVVADSIIRGRGPRTEPGQGQNGIQVSGPGAGTTIVRNLVTDHFFTLDASASAAVLLFDANVPATKINGNDFRGNGYGVFNADEFGCDSAVTVDAESNWWGDPDGPTVQTGSGPPGACGFYEFPGAPAEGDRVNPSVDFAPYSTVSHPTPGAPGRQNDAAPALTIDSPADGAEAEPGAAVTVNATATDDFDVAKVEFFRGTTAVPTTKTSASKYSATVSAPAAGETEAITVVATDSAGSSTARSVSVRGSRPVSPPVTPQQPAEPEDRPPVVAITGPGEGAAIDPAAAPRLTADASDDRGVARVAFLDDGKVVCTDDTAPYDCSYGPSGDDVGRNTLIAIAVDDAGQTGVDFRRVDVRRFQPKLTARTTPGRDRKRPYRYTTTGSVLLPTGVTPAQACAGGASVSIEFRAGKLALPQTTTLQPDCSFRSSIAFPSRRSLGSGRLAVSAKFGGNGVLGAATARTQTVRAG